MSTDEKITALFIGGPWDGQFHTVPANRQQYRVPTYHGDKEWHPGHTEVILHMETCTYIRHDNVLYKNGELWQDWPTFHAPGWE